MAGLAGSWRAIWSPATVRLACRRRRGARHRRLRQRVLPLDQRQGVQHHRHLAGASSEGALFANPCFTQIHPTCIPADGDYQSKLTLMCESLRNDGRIWVPLTKATTPARRRRSPRTSATTTWSAAIRASATWRRATSPRGRQAGLRRGPRGRDDAGLGVYLDFADAIARLGARGDRASGTATCSTMYERSPTRTRTRCRCASTRAALHDGRALGGL